MASGQVLFRTIDGTYNNLFFPENGSAGVPLLRLSTVGYSDGISTPAGVGQPSAREISNAVCAQSGSIPNARPVTDFVWQWGQFVDHDIDLTGAADPAEAFNVLVPTGDPQFDPSSTGTQVIPLDRSLYAPGFGPRQQINQITAYIDGSMVYGSDPVRAKALRAMDGTGRLKTSAGNLLPFDPDDPTMFIAGDVRANEQVGLTSLHTLFMREHNFWCDAFNIVAPYFDGDFVYELSRAIVGAEIQKITYEEFLPALLGPNALQPYAGYDFLGDAGIANSFSTSAYRFGHSMLSPTLMRLNASMDAIPDGPLPLKDAFFNPAVIINGGGIDPILRGLATQRPQEVDPFVVDDVRNFLFGAPGSGGFDLASLNLQRGRDHGLPRYNQLRSDFGLPQAATFADISSDAATQAALGSVYATPDDVDAWVGILSEDHVGGALVGELALVMLRSQFERLRDADRFWYQIHFGGIVDAVVKNETLARVIWRNTSVGFEIQPQVFHQVAP
ncbi:peroxidase family protein [Engelhardtia mirabilis]